MYKMSVKVLVDELQTKVSEIEQFITDIEAQMEDLDMNSKDYQDLDFEYNYYSGMIVGYRHSLTMAKLHEEK